MCGGTPNRVVISPGGLATSASGAARPGSARSSSALEGSEPERRGRADEQILVVISPGGLATPHRRVHSLRCAGRHQPWRARNYLAAVRTARLRVVISPGGLATRSRVAPHAHRRLSSSALESARSLEHHSPLSARCHHQLWKVRNGTGVAVTGSTTGVVISPGGLTTGGSALVRPREGRSSSALEGSQPLVHTALVAPVRRRHEPWRVPNVLVNRQDSANVVPVVISPGGLATRPSRPRQ